MHGYQVDYDVQFVMLLQKYINNINVCNFLFWILCSLFYSTRTFIFVLKHIIKMNMQFLCYAYMNMHIKHGRVNL